MTLLTVLKQLLKPHPCQYGCEYSTHDLVQLQIHHEIEHSGDYDLEPHRHK